MDSEEKLPVIYPVDPDLADDGSGRRLDLKVGFKMASWFSIEYVLGVRRLPLLVDNGQVWHGLLGSFAFNLIGG